MAPAPYLVILPKGLIVSGITTWALRVCGALGAAGRPVGIAAHRAPPGHETLHAKIPPGVRVFDLSHLPEMERCGGDLSEFIPAYARAARDLAPAAAGPCVMTPYYLGDCVGAVSALTLADGARVRLLAVQQLLVPYETHVLSHYEPVISRFVGVSDEIAAGIRGALPHRSGDVRSIPNCAVVPATPPPARLPLEGRPLRLIYTGRLEQAQKRVFALVELSRELARRGVEHRLTAVGDGPAAEEFDAMIGHTDLGARVRRRAPVAPELVDRLLDDHDVFVLPSRSEGLSLSLVEAMARSCVPVIARTPSGAAQTVEPGVNGEIVDIAPDADDVAAGSLLADGVQRVLSRGLPRLAHASWEKTRAKFSLERCAGDFARVIDECAASPPRSWPATRPLAFTGAPSEQGSGSVPPDGAIRLREALARLAGRRVIVHGTGRHTLELAGVLAESPASIVALADDDPARHGRSLWNWPIVAPADAARTGATDVVISSWINQGAIWERRAVYVRQGLAVHRLYEA